MRKFGLVLFGCFVINASAWAEVCLYQHNDYRGGRACFDRDVSDFDRIGIERDVPVPAVEIVGPRYDIETMQVGGDVQRCFFVAPAHPGDQAPQ